MTDMTTRLPRLRVLIIGAGRRVQNNFLPVLKLAEDAFEVVGLHAKTTQRMEPLAALWGVPAVHDLAGFDLSQVDLVALSVPTGQNAVVLAALAEQGAHLQILIDTPVAWNRKELAAIQPLLNRFRRIVVAEDYMNNPHYALVREAVADGAIGTLVSMTLLNIGYLYHGLALIRSLVGFQAIRGARRLSIGQFATTVTYRFAGGFKAAVIGPYRRNRTGGIIVEGTKGVITEAGEDRDFGHLHGRALLVLTALRSEGELVGYELIGGTKPYQIALPELTAMRSMPFSDKSDLNLLRGYGLMVIFRSLLEQDGINQHYGASNAFYDSFVSRLAECGKLPIDPFVWFGGSIMTLIRLIAPR